MASHLSPPQLIFFSYLIIGAVVTGLIYFKRPLWSSGKVTGFWLFLEVSTWFPLVALLVWPIFVVGYVWKCLESRDTEEKL